MVEWKTPASPNVEGFEDFVAVGVIRPEGRRPGDVVDADRTQAADDLGVLGGTGLVVAVAGHDHSERAAGETESQHDVAAQMRGEGVFGAESRRDRRDLAAKPSGQVEVVGQQGREDHLGDPRNRAPWRTVEDVEHDLPHIAQLPGPEQVMGDPVAETEAAVMVNAQGHALARGGLDEPNGVGDGGRQGLLAEDVTTGRDRRQRNLGVQIIGRRHGHHVNAGTVEQIAG